MTVVYRTTAVSTGNGRNGRSRTTDGVLDLNLTTPRTNAGPGDPTNPEQLFAAGFSACLHSAVKNRRQERPASTSPTRRSASRSGS